MSEMLHLADFRKKNRGQRVCFDRRELRQLLDLYSRRVASGEWKDYAIDQYGPMAMFSVFRHSFDRPAFSVVKRATGKTSDYVVFSGQGKLKSCKTMADALTVLERQLRVV